jgi:hypothetical protein
LKSDLYEGFALRSTEIVGDTYFYMGDTGMYIEIGNSITNPEKITPEILATKYKGKDIIKMNPQIAWSYTGTEFGLLNNTKSDRYNKPLHTVVSVARTKFRGYAHNAFNDLKDAAKKIINKDKPRVRNGNDNFTMAVERVFATLEIGFATLLILLAKDEVKITMNDNNDRIKFFFCIYNIWGFYKIRTLFLYCVQQNSNLT